MRVSKRNLSTQGGYDARSPEFASRFAGPSLGPSAAGATRINCHTQAKGGGEATPDRSDEEVRARGPAHDEADESQHDRD
jgi:hypothetical protein